MVGEDRIAQEFAAIKARERAIREAIERGDPEIDAPGSWTTQQLGLDFAYADKAGRIWRFGGGKLTRIYPEPEAPFRAEAMLACADDITWLEGE